MATTNEVQMLYIAYFNRPADTAGLVYWATSPMSLKDISNSFAAQKEYTDVYGNLGVREVINSLYKNMFGHEADFHGVNYWETEISAGRTTLGTAAFLILTGAQGKDKIAIDAKKIVAEAFTKSIDTTAEVLAYDTAAGKIPAKQWLAKVIDYGTLATATSEIDATLVAVVKAAAQNVAFASGTNPLLSDTSKAELAYTLGGDKHINSFQSENVLTESGHVGVKNTLHATLGNDNGSSSVIPASNNHQIVNVHEADLTGNVNLDVTNVLVAFNVPADSGAKFYTKIKMGTSNDVLWAGELAMGTSTIKAIDGGVGSDIDLCNGNCCVIGQVSMVDVW